jgi:hypothetical protein
VRKIKLTGPPRWRKQAVRDKPDNRCTCGKLYYASWGAAESHAHTMSLVHGRPHYVYEHHGRVHMTTMEQD